MLRLLYAMRQVALSYDDSPVGRYYSGGIMVVCSILLQYKFVFLPSAMNQLHTRHFNNIYMSDSLFIAEDCLSCPVQADKVKTF